MKFEIIMKIKKLSIIGTLLTLFISTSTFAEPCDKTQLQAGDKVYINVTDPKLLVTREDGGLHLIERDNPGFGSTKSHFWLSVYPYDGYKGVVEPVESTLTVRMIETPQSGMIFGNKSGTLKYHYNAVLLDTEMDFHSEGGIFLANLNIAVFEAAAERVGFKLKVTKQEACR